jgi:hypothetical protein
LHQSGADRRESITVLPIEQHKRVVMLAVLERLTVFELALTVAHLL